MTPDISNSGRGYLNKEIDAIIKKQIRHLPVPGNNKNTRTMWETHSKLTMKKPEWRKWRRSKIQKDEELIENILRRATKLIPGLYNKPYKERLAAIKFSSMAYRRMRSNMILLYKILRGGNQSLRDLFMINFNLTFETVFLTKLWIQYLWTASNQSWVMPGKIKDMWFNKKKLQNQAKILLTIGLVVSTNSSS